MVDIIEHDGVTQWRFASRWSQMAGYTASAFLTADGLLVDTGIPASRREFAALLDRHHVRAVMITHHHEDHAGNVEQVAGRGLPIWMPDATLPLVRHVERIRAYRRFTWFSMPPLRSPVVAFTPDTLIPVATPGHSADHHVLFDSATSTLFSGDLFLGVAVRITHHDEDPWEQIASLERAAALEPVRLFDAHRGLVPDAAAALRAKAAWIREMVSTMQRAITSGQTDAQILRSIMGGESVTGLVSGGEYSRRNFIRAVRRGPTT
jgi:glyoxylase-like metal-dependent hydrolase (beta-lactamase superfamily II)